MSVENYFKLESVSLKDHPDLNEKWVQDRIAEDPGMLGLGELVLRDRERAQPRAGRLDLLLQDPETNHRYEVEIQLGKTDESHIIRTIEYWDLERRRYPQYEHTAVIVAEEITTRFLNVISLFNGNIPLIALQVRSYKVGDKYALVFTKVLDELRLGLVDEDEEVQETTDRSYWEIKGSKATVAMADELLAILHQFAPKLALKYNKFYIGLARDGKASNFVVFRPKKNWISVEPRLEQSEATGKRLAEQGLDTLPYDNRWGRYRINLAKGDVKKHEAFLLELLKGAFEGAAE